MNRLHHIKETLQRNIEDNLDYPNAEFVLLDYNSSDGLQEWVKENLNEFVLAGKLIYARTESPSYFRRSHSRNLAFKIATGDLVCNVDADNFIGSGFATFLANIFRKTRNVFVAADNTGKYYRINDAVGRFCGWREDFFDINGYDEKIDGYGFEDVDLCERLHQLGRKKVVIKDVSYLKTVEHDHAERVKNEWAYKSLHGAFIHYANEWSSEVLLLFSNGRYHRRDFVNFISMYSANLSASWLTHQEIISIEERRPVVVEEDGKWEQKGEKLHLNEDSRQSETPCFFDKKTIVIPGGKYATFYKIENSDLLVDILLLYSMNKNKKQFEENKAISSRVNTSGFGQDIIVKNFINDSPINVY